MIQYRSTAGLYVAAPIVQYASVGKIHKVIVSCFRIADAGPYGLGILHLCYTGTKY